MHKDAQASFCYDRVMKLMTYNILNGAVDTFQRICDIVNIEQPDLLVLNEANGFDLHNQAKLVTFSESTSLPYYDLALCGDGGEYNVTILSKTPLLNIKHLDGFARAAIAVELTTEMGVVSLVGTHLSPFGEPERVNEIKQIIKAQEGYEHKIVLGDLNSLSPQDDYDPSMVFAFNAMQTKKFTAKERLLFDAINAFDEAGYVDPAVIAGQEKIYTAPTSINEFQAHSNMRLDYILMSSSMVDYISSYKVVKNDLTEHASDHYPVVVELKLQ